MKKLLFLSVAICTCICLTACSSENGNNVQDENVNNNEIVDNKDIVEETIRKDLFTYKYASKELKNDNIFLNDVIKKYPQDFEKFLSEHWEKLPYIDDKKIKLCYYVKEQLDKNKSNKITKFKPNNKQIKKSNIVVFPSVEENEELVKTI